MKKLSRRGMLWLKCLHLLSAGAWLGSGLSLLLLILCIDLSGTGTPGITRAMKFIDDFVIIPGALGTLITGMAYSVWTNWGFFRHRWITVKWIITAAGILFGTFFLGPWTNGMEEAARLMGDRALLDSGFLHCHTMNGIFGPLQVGSLVFALFISSLKPWKKKGGDA